MSFFVMRFSFAMAVATLALGGSAKADLTPIFDTAATNGGQTVFTYHVALSAGSNVAGGSNNQYVTMYDFIGYVAGSATVTGSFSGNNADWVVSEQAIGKTPGQVSPIDSPSLTNISFTWNNSGGIVGAVNNVLTFTLTSTNPLAAGQFTQYSGSSTNSSNSTAQSNLGFIQGPNASFVPEPSTYVLLGLGSALCTAYARRNRRLQVA